MKKLQYGRRNDIINSKVHRSPSEQLKKLFLYILLIFTYSSLYSYKLYLIKTSFLLLWIKPKFLTKIAKFCKLIPRLTQPNIKNYAFVMILVLLGLTISSNAIALSAITVNTIQGSAPYLSFDRKGTKANSTEHLLSITLSDGRQYSIRNNPSSENNPIELPAVDQKLKDIKKFIPEGKSVVTLTDVVSTNKFWKDDDGDSSISVTGNLTMTVQNVDGKIVNENTELNACYSPYKITLTSDSGILSTQYGKLEWQHIFKQKN